MKPDTKLDYHFNLQCLLNLTILNFSKFYDSGLILNYWPNMKLFTKCQNIYQQGAEDLERVFTKIKQEPLTKIKIPSNRCFVAKSGLSQITRVPKKVVSPNVLKVREVKVKNKSLSLFPRSEKWNWNLVHSFREVKSEK